MARIYGILSAGTGSISDTLDNGTVSGINGSASAAWYGALALRLQGVSAELVYTDMPAGATGIGDNAVWHLAESYSAGRSHGERDANFGDAYEGLTADDMPDADVPAQFTDTADIWDYQAGYEAGYESHWADSVDNGDGVIR